VLQGRVTDLRAVVLEAPESLALTEREEVRAGSGEVLIDISATGICGTDVSIFAGKIPVQHPLVMGHEMVGRVVEVGANVRRTDLAPGTRVVVDPNLYCGVCYQCSKGQANICPAGALMGRDRDGAFRDAIAVPASNVYPLPEKIEDLVAPLIQVLTTCVHGQRTAPLFAGDSALVLGLGVTGLLHLQVARARGASPLIGVTRSDSKRRLGEALGADLTLDAEDPRLDERIREATSGRGPDVVIECVGQVKTLAQAIRWARIGGHVMLFGTITADRGELPFYQLYYRQITWTNPRAAKPEDFPAAIDLASRRAVRLERLVTDTLPLEKAADAIAATTRRSSLKVILDHHGRRP
jgi:2-desacetyl-2-hydroxyethyl bacteriochlorophyllide A dehydrogenase